jgi:MYXO-CTERM domain-containing protein
MNVQEEEGSSESGCGCRTAPARPSFAGWLGLGFALLGAARRRRTARARMA